mgnify:CR=1 FL=1|tara:strand:- start:27 stop:473 length:447 start_codon:yes stop_codon:yes gene_type:complete
MIAYSQILSEDSTNYPQWGIDPQGVYVVTITKNQQQNINNKLIQLGQCRNREVIKIDYIKALELQLSDYKSTLTLYDSTSYDCSIMLDNRASKIQELNLQLGLKNDLQRQTENNYKAAKRKLIGWKIGTFTTIGVVVIAIPVTLAILL